MEIDDDNDHDYTFKDQVVDGNQMQIWGVQ